MFKRYKFVGTKTDQPLGKIVNIDQTYVVEMGYLIPYYITSTDQQAEKYLYLESLTKRFFRHCELFIEIERSDAQIADIKQEYDTTANDDDSKRIKGAMLVGAVAKRFQSLCREIIGGNDNVREKLEEYFLLLTDEELRSHVDIRDGHEYISEDTSSILFEAASEIFKAGSRASNDFLFFKSRRMKIANAMEQIDLIADTLIDFVSGSFDNENLINCVHDLATAAKARCAIRGSDVGFYEQSVIDYDVAHKRLLAATEKRPGLAKAFKHGAMVIEYMVELREPLEKSCKKFHREIQAAVVVRDH